MMKRIYHWLTVLCIIGLLVVNIGLLIRTEQLQAQLDGLQGQVDIYRTLIFKLYGENGG